MKPVRSTARAPSSTPHNPKLKTQPLAQQPQPSQARQKLRKSTSSLRLSLRSATMGHNEQQPIVVSKNPQKKDRPKVRANQEQEKMGFSFNLNQNVARCGWSAIEKLEYQLAIEKRLRLSLQRENQQLRKQINFLNNFAVGGKPIPNPNKPAQQTNKQKILNRLNKKREPVISDNDSTGIFSAKTKSYEQSINQLYEDYAKKKQLPALQTVYQLCNKYFSQFQQLYTKLFILFNHSKGTVKTQLSGKLQDLLFLFQVPIFYKQRPKQLMKSVSRERKPIRSEYVSKESSKDNSLSNIEIGKDQRAKRMGKRSGNDIGCL